MSLVVTEIQMDKRDFAHSLLNTEKTFYINENPLKLARRAAWISFLPPVAVGRNIWWKGTGNESSVKILLKDTSTLILKDHMLVLCSHRHPPTWTCKRFFIMLLSNRWHGAALGKAVLELRTPRWTVHHKSTPWFKEKIDIQCCA